MRKWNLFLLFTPILLSGCAYSVVSSFKDPGFDIDHKYNSIVVAATNLPLDERIQAEKYMVKLASKKGIRAIAGMKIMPPTRVNDKRSIAIALRNSGASGLLLLWATSKETREQYIPPTVISGGSSYTTGTVSQLGGIYTFNALTQYTPPVIIGGFTVEKPTATYKAALYDIKSGRKVWIADIRSRGNAYASYMTLARSAAEETINKLDKDGLINPQSGRKKANNKSSFLFSKLFSR